jgi:3-hydroxyisobutyrate dehydrogenase-like beta-hydroxyacid dehydrogenase
MSAQRYAEEQMNIAWIGTGIMGAPMARRLLKAGHRRHWSMPLEKFENKDLK